MAVALNLPKSLWTSYWSRWKRRVNKNPLFAGTTMKTINNIWMIIAVTGLAIFLGLLILTGVKDPFEDDSL